MAAALILSACGGGDSVAGYRIAGTISGLNAAGLVLQNGSEQLSVPANAGSFEFAAGVPAGGAYSATVATQPTGLFCTVSEGTGSNVHATINTIHVVCNTQTYSIAGTVTGLTAAGLVLLNGGERLSVPANSASFEFATDVAPGGAYSATVATQPTGLLCTVSEGAGSNVQATVSTIHVVCSAQTHSIAGTVTGLTANGLVLQNNGADYLTVAANATSFRFATPITAGGGYRVAVLTQPVGLTCTIGNGSGANVNTDIITVQILCSGSVLGIGGTITGLTGNGLVLQNNAADDLTVAARSPTFEFDAPVAYGAHYAITVLTQPAGQMCSVAQGSNTATTAVHNIAVTCTNIPTYTVTPNSGTNGSISPAAAVVVNSGGSQGFVATPAASYAVNQWLVDNALVQSGGSVYTLTNIRANHAVTVTFAQTTLVSSVASLALAVNCLPASGCATMQYPALTGTSRQITITNAGSLAALNVAVTPSGLPSGTNISGSTCGSVLAAADSCTITIAPGAVASGGCTSGVAPTPGTVSVSADDAATVAADVVVVSYGCIYQQGFIYSVDDTTPNTGSIGGKTAALTDSFPAQTNPTAGNPNWGGYGTDLGASLYENTSQGANDGAANSAAIISALTTNYSSPPYSGGSPVPLTNYAAGLCSAYSVDADGNSPCASGTCYTNWHLPAICELTTVGGTGCTSGSTSIEGQLFSATPPIAALGIPDGSFYWSSTEFSGVPTIYGFTELFLSSGGSLHAAIAKNETAGVRCSRVLTP